jgi:hypothetical protein
MDQGLQLEMNAFYSMQTGRNRICLLKAYYPIRDRFDCTLSSDQPSPVQQNHRTYDSI